MRAVAARAIAEGVARVIPRLATSLRADVLAALERAAAHEPFERARYVLGQLIANATIADRDEVPLCQDTGSVWVCVEMGAGACIEGDLQREVDAAVARAYREAGLRMSLVRDALFDRTNSGDNTPAFVDVVPSQDAGVRVHVMLKGGGSDNASIVRMLDPAAGPDGVIGTVVEAVRTAGASACPPLVVGVGVGGTFDAVAKLAKKALLVPLDQQASDPEAAAFEARLLEAVNATGVGPAGLGGATTALACRVLTAPCHIAALPVAVNLGCYAMRSTSFEVA